MFVTDDGLNVMFTFILVSSLFLLWGFCNGMIDVMDKHFQEELGLSKSQSAWVHECMEDCKHRSLRWHEAMRLLSTTCDGGRPRNIRLCREHQSGIGAGPKHLSVVQSVCMLQL